MEPDLQKLQAGDQAEWDSAYALLWPVAFASARRRMESSHPQYIEDVAIAAIADAAGQIPKMSSFEHLRALVGIIAKRKAIDFLKQQNTLRRGGGQVDDPERLEEVPDTLPNPLERVAADDLARMVVSLMEFLTERERVLLHGFYGEGLTQAELARREGIPIGSIGATLARAIGKIRLRFGSWCVF